MSQHTYDGCGMCRYCGAGNYEVARGRKPPGCPSSPPQDKADAANMYGQGLEQGYRDAIEKGQAEIDALRAKLAIAVEALLASPWTPRKDEAFAQIESAGTDGEP